MAALLRIVALSALVIAAAPGIALAQGIFGPGASFIGGGVSGIGTGNLDERLAARRYPTFGTSAVGLVLGTYHILPGGLSVGGEWHGLIIGDEVHQGRDVGIGGGYGTLGLGYVVELSRGLRVYPRLGLGGGGMGMWFERDSVVNFDDVLADPKPTPDPPREPVLSRVSVLMDLGVGAEVLPGGIGRGLMFGVRLGYLVAPSSSEWQLYGHDVIGGPATSLRGPYIRGVIGVGRRR